MNHSLKDKALLTLFLIVFSPAVVLGVVWHYVGAAFDCGVFIAKKIAEAAFDE